MGMLTLDFLKWTLNDGFTIKLSVYLINVLQLVSSI